MRGSLGQDGARPQLCTGHTRLLVPHGEGSSSGCPGVWGTGAQCSHASLAGPGPSISSASGIRPGCGWLSQCPQGREKEGLGQRGQNYDQGITGWKVSPAQKKFQGNGDFSPGYIYNFFLKPILLPSTDLYFINFQFCKRGGRL